MKRLAVLAIGALALAGCSGQSVDGNSVDTVKAGVSQSTALTSADAAPDGANVRVVSLPPADVTIANVTAFNGGFAVATALAQEQCTEVGRRALRISDATPDGFVQFNCVPFPKLS